MIAHENTLVNFKYFSKTLSTFVKFCVTTPKQSKIFVTFEIEPSERSNQRPMGHMNSYKSLIQHFSLSIAMATNQNDEFAQFFYTWWRPTQQTFLKTIVKIPAMR